MKGQCSLTIDMYHTVVAALEAGRSAVVVAEYPVTLEAIDQLNNSSNIYTTTVIRDTTIVSTR